MPEMRCANCAEPVDASHTDLCCTCFRIAFGRVDHAQEHADASEVGSETYNRNAERVARHTRAQT